MLEGHHLTPNHLHLILRAVIKTKITYDNLLTSSVIHTGQPARLTDTF